MTSNNSETFDGLPVGAYEGKFQGVFDVADDYSFDEAVTWLVTTRVAGAAFGETKSGDIKRLNTYAVTGSTPMSAAEAKLALDALSAGAGGGGSGGIHAAIEDHLAALTVADGVAIDDADLLA